jgi:hypothetical protein
VKSVWAGLGDQAIGDSVVVDGPVVLDLQLSQLLRSGECNWELLHSSHEGILRLVEHLLRLEDGQDLGLLLQSLLAEHKVGQLVNVDVTLRTLHCEELTALRPGGRQLRDPVWRRSNHFERVVLEMEMGYIGEKGFLEWAQQSIIGVSKEIIGPRSTLSASDQLSCSVPIANPLTSSKTPKTPNFG